MFFVGVAFAFAALHSFLFLFHRKERGNLYLAVAALGFASLELWESLGTKLGMVRLQTLGLLSLVVMILGFLRFGHDFTGQPSPRIFRFFFVAGLVVVLWNAATGDRYLPLVFILLSLLELVRGLVAGTHQPTRKHSWLVGLGFLAILVTATNDTLSGLGILPTAGGTYPYGMLVLFLALSVYLSWRFADTYRDLEHKLVEVETLSQQAIEQERLVKRQEIERRLLEQERASQREQLEAARRLQLSFLPARSPKVPGLEVEFEMRTASEVGGDYYDYRQGEDGALLLAVGDAAGHGLDAGLLVAATKGLFHATSADEDLRATLDRIASGLRSLRLQRMFMALTLLRYERGQLELVTAGMPPLLLKRHGQDGLEELSVHAPPLGAMGAVDYDLLRTELRPGDTLLAMTDGLPERRNPEDEVLGYRRLADEYEGASAAEELDVVRATLFTAVESWAAGSARHDDETIVLLRRTGAM